jgi:hypothetical protein
MVSCYPFQMPDQPDIGEFPHFIKWRRIADGWNWAKPREIAMFLKRAARII